MHFARLAAASSPKPLISELAPHLLCVSRLRLLGGYMKPDVLVVESDISAFAIADRRLRDRFHLVWAPSYEAAHTAMSRLSFDAVLTRADDDPSFAFISRASAEHPAIPVIAIAQWEVQGDRAAACGAKDWISAPVNFHRLAAILDFVIVKTQHESPRLTHSHLMVAPA